MPSSLVCRHEFSDAQRDLQPVYTERESNSIVEGDTLQALMQSLWSTAEYQGRGNTKWTVSWSFDTTPVAGGCVTENVQADVAVNYHLPLWPDQITTVNRTLSDQWTQYSDALRAHHCKHGKAGIDASLDVKSSLQQLSGSGSCALLTQQADALARTIIDDYKAAEAGFTLPRMSDYLQR